MLIIKHTSPPQDKYYLALIETINTYWRTVSQIEITKELATELEKGKPIQIVPYF